MTFWVTVYLNPDDEDRNAENTLASWEGSLHRWHALDDLLEAGKLTQSRSDNFPSLYRGLASDILPMLPPDRGTYPARIFKPEVHWERINACPPDAVLGIEIWDQC